MHKRQPSTSDNLDFVQGKNNTNNHKKNRGQLIEIAAEQFADLLWKTWLFRKGVNGKKTKPE